MQCSINIAARCCAAKKAMKPLEISGASHIVAENASRFRGRRNRSKEGGMRGQVRAFKNIERHVLSQYDATRLPSGEHQLKLLYRTDQELEDLVDDLLFEIAGEAQLSDCYSETEARLEGTDRRW
jgi:hypothetical protein